MVYNYVDWKDWKLSLKDKFSFSKNNSRDIKLKNLDF